MIQLNILDPVHTQVCWDFSEEFDILKDSLEYYEVVWRKKPVTTKSGRVVWKLGKEKHKKYMLHLNEDGALILSGFIPTITQAFSDNNVQYSVVGLRCSLPFDNPQLPGITFRPDQKDLIIKGLKTGRGVLQAPTGSGKCHRKNTKILLHNGEIKNVQDIKAGELLMGPDSKPRKVLTVSTGFGQMYKIIPLKGEPFECNEDHILSLKSTATMSKGLTYKKNKITNLPIKEYLKKSKTFKHMMKLWRIGVDFPEQPTKVPPYLVGLYLGDGTKNYGASITTGNHDPEVEEYIELWAKKNNFRIRVEKRRKCKTRFIVFKRGHKNWFLDFKKTLVTKKNERCIPENYLINSKENRLELLAGIIDTDGHHNKNTYDLVCKDKIFADQVVFLIRSLGLSASISKKKATIKKINFSGVYWRICISGNTNIIPCKIPRKKAKKREQKKDNLKTGFSIIPTGEHRYYGFTLEGDGLYLLKDFTVTHNTIILMGIISAFKNENILFLGNTLIVVGQFREALISRGFTDIGLISGEEKTHGRIQLALIQSFSRLDPKSYVNKYDVILCDECHHVSKITGTYGKVLQNSLAPVRIGVTATMPYKKEAELSLAGLIGPKLGEVTIKEGLEIGITAKPIIKIFKTPSLVHVMGLRKYPEVYTAGIVQNEYRNNLIAKLTKSLVDQNLSVLITVKLLTHGRILKELISSLGVDTLFVEGSVEGEDRITVKNMLNNKKILCVIASTVFREAVDIPTLNCCINAAGGKSEIATLQALGRGLRVTKQKSKILLIDFKDSSHRFLINHYKQRVKVYQKIMGG